MHSTISAIVLGIVEGLTEFLPISSTGHLILVNHFFRFSEQFTSLFDIVIQLGAILAVVVYFWKRLFPLGQKPAEAMRTLTLWGKTIVGVLPALAIGAVAAKQIKAHLFNPLTVALALLIGGIILIWLESRKKKATITTVEKLSYGTALGIGLIQCLAMVPGTSRSAATIIGAMLLGSSRVVATEFSFFLAIPTLFAASVFSLLKAEFVLSSAELKLLLIGFVVAFLVALVVIDTFLKFIAKYDFKCFGVYRILLGVLILGYLFK
jgi:undecaprenyl-diphosphatase